MFSQNLSPPVSNVLTETGEMYVSCMFPILPVNVPRSNLLKNPGEKHSMLLTHKLVILKISKAYVVMLHNSKGNENLTNPKSGL